MNFKTKAMTYKINPAQMLYDSLTDNGQREAFLAHFGHDVFTWVPQKFEDIPRGFRESIMEKSKLPEFDGFIPPLPLG